MFETLALRIENQRLKEKLCELCEMLGIEEVKVYVTDSEVKHISEELNYYKEENKKLIDIIEYNCEMIKTTEKLKNEAIEMAVKLQNELNVYKYGKKGLK